MVVREVYREGLGLCGRSGMKWFRVKGSHGLMKPISWVQLPIGEKESLVLSAQRRQWLR